MVGVRPTATRAVTMAAFEIATMDRTVKWAVTLPAWRRISWVQGTTMLRPFVTHSTTRPHQAQPAMRDCQVTIRPTQRLMTGPASTGLVLAGTEQASP